MVPAFIIITGGWWPGCDHAARQPDGTFLPPATYFYPDTDLRQTRARLWPGLAWATARTHRGPQLRIIIQFAQTRVTECAYLLPVLAPNIVNTLW